MKQSLHLNKVLLLLAMAFIGLSSLQAQLVNCNPDPNGEQWIAGNLPEITPEIQTEYPLSLIPKNASNLSNSSVTEDFWERMSFPDNSLNCLGHDSNGNIYIRTNEAYYRLDDNDLNWIQIHQGTGNNIYIDELDRIFIMGYYIPTPLEYSVDYGENWSTLTNSIQCYSLYANDSLIIAGTLFTGYIIKSTDFGITWDTVFYHDANGDASSITSLFSVGNGIIIAGVFDYCGEGCIYRSIDNGDNWEKVFDGSRIVDIDADSEGSIYAVGDGIFRSSDTGITWEPVYDPENPQYFSVQSIVIDKNDIIYITKLQPGVFRSSDGGKNFEQITSGMDLYDVQKLELLPDGYLYAFANYDCNRLYRSRKSVYTVFSVDEQQEKMHVTLYPNPCANNFALQFSSETECASVELYNLQGRLVSTQNNGFESISTEHLTKGTYLVKVTLADGKVYTEKIVKE